MEILFLILKLIGILFFVVFLLLLALITVPVRYRICMEAQDDIGAAGMFSWFCRLINFKIEYKEKDIAFQLRILGIPILRDREKHKNSKKGTKSTERIPNQKFQIRKNRQFPKSQSLCRRPFQRSGRQRAKRKNRADGFGISAANLKLFGSGFWI